MNTIFNSGDIVRSHWDKKDYIILEVFGDILCCISNFGYIELMDFEVDLIKRGN